ncbi:MAG: galactose mutarotase [Lachnospiraceae bacterium]|nr:galactose mutarotase [Lachnospiraceae bacterium]
MAITKESFGMTKNGEAATLYTMENANGMKVAVTDFGANIVKILVPDRNQEFADVALGYASVEGYEKNSPGYGSLIGRHANRIGGAKFVINGKEYELEKNDNGNNLHSGSKSFNKYMYEAELAEGEESDSIEFSRTSPDMEQGFPGNLNLSVKYTLTDDNELILEYYAVSDQDTIINLTNHSYFNLAGHNSGDILDHTVTIYADLFTPTSDDLIPTGEIAEVEGTPMDFREPKKIGRDIEADYYPLKQGGGYDHNYCLNKEDDEIALAAELSDEKSGRYMLVYTDLPGIQFYTGNFIDGTEIGKDGMCYQKRGGVCFETQYFPNSCNRPNFPSCVFKAGEEYCTATIYKFGCR